jgi:uncharacterized protein (TIGR00299 family) protein
MRIAYFDCFSGISGDMILGALVDAGLDMDALRQELNKLPLQGWEMKARRTERGGMSGTLLEIKVTQRQGERGLSEILGIIDQSQLDEGVVDLSKRAFSRLAEAEAKVHSIQANQVHFHEVGATDAIVDVVGSMVGLKLLDVKKVFSSPLRLGRGFLECRHGTLPVPAPATVELLREVPIQMSEVEAELVTPTGAAVLTTVASAFRNSPSLCLQQIGYGAGQRKLRGIPNLLRVLIGEEREEWEEDQAVVLETNIDDMSPEMFAPLMEVLFAEGALDAHLTPVVMKKGRPAVVLTVLAPGEKVAAVTEAIFRHTTTLGVRSHRVRRSRLPRQIRQVKTRWGPLTVKVALYDGAERISPEYEDCLRVAREKKVPLGEVYQEVRRSWEMSGAEDSQSSG